MVYFINKTAGWCLSPAALAVILTAAGAVLAWKGRRKTAVVLLAAAIAWQWIWGTGLWMRVVSLPLERMYPVVLAEDSPAADAIVVLGGGMSSNKDAYPYADICEGGDRVWHAARLYKAGKAPVVVATGLLEEHSTVPFLLDLGVPASAIRVEGNARNTEENARFVSDMLRGKAAAGRKPRILLVTSAQHMRRAALMYSKYAPELEIIPAATDYCTTVCIDKPLEFADFFPNSDAVQKNSSALKELVGYWGYRLLRR